MGRPAKNAVKPTDDAKSKDDKDKVLTPEEVADVFLKANMKDHLNFQKGDTYRVSTGSLKMDIITGGGIEPGLTRLVGTNSGGKTSEALELMRNFFLVRPKGRGLFVKAEGRLSQQMIERSGIKFVLNPIDWIEGTCLIYECNIYDSVASFIMSLILNNKTRTNFFFVIDSLDGLILRDDMAKELKDSFKVAGPAVIGKKLMQKCFGPLVKFGHIMVATSQITAQPKIETYAKVEYRGFESSGGNAMKHYPDNIWEYLPRFKDHRILRNPKVDYDQAKNPIIGHLARVTVRKSSNEKNDVSVTYPIKYGQKNGNSIWKEREIGDVIIGYYMEIKGSWFTFREDFLKELREIDKTVPEKIQGTDQLYEFLEKNKTIANYCFDKFRKALTEEQIWTGEEDPLEDEGNDELEDAKEL